MSTADDWGVYSPLAKPSGDQTMPAGIQPPGERRPAAVVTVLFYDAALQDTEIRFEDLRSLGASNANILSATIRELQNAGPMS